MRGDGVLIRLSAGYPPVEGRLHTRYSPVRRSPPVYCYTALPLDLHVLGLPLAFILSQDQTLRCNEDLLTLLFFRILAVFICVRLPVFLNLFSLVPSRQRTHRIYFVRPAGRALRSVLLPRFFRTGLQR